MSDHPTAPYRLKTERAKAHVKELAAEIEAFKAKDPYVVVIEDDTQRSQRIWKLRVNHCVPEHLATIVGDVIHNARTSLDLLMCAVVRHCDPIRQSIKHVHFIVRETKAKFEADLPENIKGASPGAIKLIHDLKPYKCGNEALWRLHQLDVLDKHQAIIPVGAGHRSLGIPLGGFPIFTPWGMEVPPAQTVFFRSADTQFPLKDGAELLTIPFAQRGQIN
jgi:hypothetical protein